MPVPRVSRQDGFHCFFCNASVGPEDERCPKCGRELGPQDGGAQRPRRVLGDRVRTLTRRRRRSYRFAVIVLGVAVILLTVLFRPKGRPGPVLPRPEGEQPELTIVETWDSGSRKLERVSVTAVADPGLEPDGLRQVLDWVLYTVLDKENRELRRRVRVVWAYVLKEATAPRSEWTAMAIWTDPSLPESARPAGIGGDAVRQGAVEYDFTNPVKEPDSGQGGD